jgi:hypothetical protein
MERDYGDWEVYTLVNGDGRAKDGLPVLMDITATDDRREIFYRAPAGNPLFDFASVRIAPDGRIIVNLFQVTVSDHHSVNVKGLKNLQEFATINFFMIRVAMCPEDVAGFKAGRGVTPLIGNQTARAAFAKVLIDDHGMDYYECIWPFYDTCKGWTADAVHAVCGLSNDRPGAAEPISEVTNFDKPPPAKPPLPAGSPQ